ncbi:hypothetical protein ACROYT_G013718 [Oculina patagonica]
MTAERFLETRAQAVFNTWGKNVAGKFTFFSSSHEIHKKLKLPVVSLPGVDDSYPPLKNSDDIYLGHAGTGAKKEREKLQLAPGDNYCMGGPGMLLSRSVLRKVAPHVEYCIQTAPKSHMHEDVELGRCIRRYVGVSCTWSYEMNTLFLHDYTANGAIFYGDLNTKNINDAITLHPIKQPAYMYRLHSHFMNERIQDLQHKAVKIQRVLRTMNRLLQSDGNRLSRQEKISLQDERDFHHQLAINNTEIWDMFTPQSFYPETSLKSPMTEIRGALNIEVNNILKITKESINEEIRKNRHLGKLKGQKVNYAYRRVHPLYGTQHIVQVIVKSAKKHLNNTRHLETFRRFMKNFELVCLKQHQRVKLVVACFSSVSSPREHKVIIKEYQDKYPRADLIWLDIAGNFSRGMALSLAADKFDQAALLFLCDVDFIFNSDFIDRCRTNAAPSKRAYFPIMFSQFDPELTYNNKTKPESYFTLNKDAGIWRPYSYEPACIYHQDLDAVGGFDTSIKGWGLEDVDLFEKFVKHTEIEVFRAADPGLIHVYHHVKCSPNLPAREQSLCQGSKASRLASQKSLVKAMLSI